MSLLITVLGFAFIITADFLLNRKYGYPLLSILSAWLYCSKRFKWLVFNVWGNDDWYYSKVAKKCGFTMPANRN